MDKSVSYRRNRANSKSFAWTYKLIKDLYKCYLKPKEDSKVGYMNRLKEYWEEIHPDLNYFSSKNVRDHVSSIIKHNIIMETSFNIENRTIFTKLITTMTLQLMPIRIALLFQIITTVIMISIMVTIETILSEMHIKYLMRLRI